MSRDDAKDDGPLRATRSGTKGAVRYNFNGIGLVAGTRIAAAGGWRAVETLRPWDMVLTFDDGLVPIADVARHRPFDDIAPWPAPLWPLRVPEGALGNRRPMLLLPDQPVMVEAEVAETLLDDPFALVPAQALAGFRGIVPEQPQPGTVIVTLAFETAQVVYGNAAVRLHCPATDRPLLLPDPLPGRYAPLPMPRALELVAVLMAEDVGAALGATPLIPYAARARPPKRP